MQVRDRRGVRRQLGAGTRVRQATPYLGFGACVLPVDRWSGNHCGSSVALADAMGEYLIRGAADGFLVGDCPVRDTVGAFSVLFHPGLPGAVMVP